MQLAQTCRDGQIAESQRRGDPGPQGAHPPRTRRRHGRLVCHARTRPGQGRIRGRHTRFTCRLIMLIHVRHGGQHHRLHESPPWGELPSPACRDKGHVIDQDLRPPPIGHQYDAAEARQDGRRLAQARHTMDISRPPSSARLKNDGFPGAPVAAVPVPRKPATTARTVEDKVSARAAPPATAPKALPSLASSLANWARFRSLSASNKRFCASSRFMPGGRRGRRGPCAPGQASPRMATTDADAWSEASSEPRRQRHNLPPG